MDALLGILMIIVWALIVGVTLALLGAPAWAAAGFGLLAAQGYGNQLQVTVARKEAARR